MLTTRLSTPTDADAMLAIYVDAAMYKHQYNDYAWKDGFSRRGIDSFIAGGNTYISFQHTDPVGVVDLSWEDHEGWDELETGDSGYIRRLAVAQAFHGQGIGQQIIDWAADEVTQHGRRYLRLDAPADNVSLRGFYEKLGFKLVQTKEFPDFGSVAAMYQRPVTSVETGNNSFQL